jgi:hypothetical protein
MMKNYAFVTVLALQSLGLRIGDGHLDNNCEASDESGSRPMMIMMITTDSVSITWACMRFFEPGTVIETKIRITHEIWSNRSKSTKPDISEGVCREINRSTISFSFGSGKKNSFPKQSGGWVSLAFILLKFSDWTRKSQQIECKSQIHQLALVQLDISFNFQIVPTFFCLKMFLLW